jgi:hypothetical protein
MSESTVLHAGNCGPDTWALEGLLKDLGVNEISAAETAAEVEQLLKQRTFTLVLLNRVFDSTGELALDVLRQLPAEKRACCMLISNYPDAHQSAVALGARAGFGKQQLHDPKTRALLQEALAK